MSETTSPTAQVAGLYRYPVKSMLGEAVAVTFVGDRGLLGDRAYALVDRETGKVASAKNPRRWGMLLECHARFLEEPRVDAALPPVEIVTPDGATLRSDDPGVDESLSRIVGRAVHLEAQAPDDPVIEQYRPHLEGFDDAKDETVTDDAIAVVAPGTFFDAAPLHVVTTSSLARLRELSPASTFPAPRFRPNVVVDTDRAGFVENEWVGRTLTLGDDVQASVFLSAPRCVMTTLAQADLPRDPGVLQAVARHNRFDIPGLGPSSCVGVYALVTTGGTARTGDPAVIS